MFRIDKASVDLSADPARIALLEVSANPARGMADSPDISSDELVEQANQEAVMIKQRALQDAEGIKKDAEMDGYIKGRKQAEDDFSSTVNAQVEEFGALVDKLIKQHDETMQQANVAAAKLAIMIAEKILHYELDHNDEAFLFLAQEAVERMNGEDKLILKVSPEEYQRFFANGGTLNGIPADKKLSIVEDNRISRGGCVVESDKQTVDASIDKQLEKVTEAFGLADKDDNRPY